MLKFELSKLIDNIYKYGECILLIKLNEDSYKEIELKVENNKLNIDDDSLLQILALLYSEAFLPEKFEQYRNYFVNRKEEQYDAESLTIFFSLPLLINGKMSSSVCIKDLSNLDETHNNKREKITLKICNLIEKMLKNSSPLTSSLDISAYQIYTSTKESSDDCSLNNNQAVKISSLTHEYFDKKLIPLSIIETLHLRKKMLEANHIGEEVRNSIEILSELSKVAKDKKIEKSVIEEIFNKYGYYNMREDFRKKILDYLKVINDDDNLDDKKTL